MILASGFGSEYIGRKCGWSFGCNVYLDVYIDIHKEVFSFFQVNAFDTYQFSVS